MNLGRLLGIGRWGLVVGAVAVGFGTSVNTGPMVWVGVGIAVCSLALTTGVKALQYGRLSIPLSQRLLVIGGWVFLAGSVAALVVDYAYAWASAGYGSFFWSLLVGTAGFAAVYVGLRLKYVPGTGGEGKEPGEAQAEAEHEPETS